MEVHGALESQRWHIVGGADRARASVQDPDRSLFQSQRPIEANAPHEQPKQASELLSVAAQHRILHRWIDHQLKQPVHRSLHG